MNTLIEATSFPKRALELLEDHLELAQLEFRYESEVGRRRFCILLVSALCLISAFVFIQIVIVQGLLHLGLSLFGACLILGILYCALGTSIYYYYGRRDRTPGEPFEATRMELRRTYQWIQKHL